MTDGDPPPRSRVAAAVEADPGIHFSGLVRRLDLARGQVQYHLRRLRAADRVVSEAVAGRTHYFPPAYGEWERGAVALLRRETVREVVVCLLDRGPSSPGAVADEVGVARSTLEYHLETLQERGVVEKHRDDRGRVTLALTRPEETVEALRTVDPSATAAAVDRFARLVDHLLFD